MRTAKQAAQCFYGAIAVNAGLKRRGVDVRGDHPEPERGEIARVPPVPAGEIEHAAPRRDEVRETHHPRGGRDVGIGGTVETGHAGHIIRRGRSSRSGRALPAAPGPVSPNQSRRTRTTGSEPVRAAACGTPLWPSAGHRRSVKTHQKNYRGERSCVLAPAYPLSRWRC